jgi:hypothetical protein
MTGSARTNTAVQSSKAIGTAAPTNVDDNNGAIYGDEDAGYGDAAATMTMHCESQQGLRTGKAFGISRPADVDDANNATQ